MYNFTVCKNQLHHFFVNADTNKICHTPLKLTVSFTLSLDFWWALYKSNIFHNFQQNDACTYSHYMDYSYLRNYANSLTQMRLVFSFHSL